MTTVHAERGRARWTFWATWAGANVLGWVAGLLLGVGLGWGLAEGLTGALGEVLAAGVGWLVGGLAGGALVGLLQAAALRELGVDLWRWALSSAVGLGLGLGLAIPLLVVIGSVGADPRAAAMFGGAGLVLAAGQWLALRRAVGRAWLWLPAGALAMVALFSIGVLLGGEGREPLAFSAGGLLYAAVTGGALALMPRRGRAGL